MRRTTLMLPTDLKARATARARELGISFGALVRQALGDYLKSPSTTESADPLLSDTAVFEGEAPTDLAANHDRHLYGDS